MLPKLGAIGVKFCEIAEGNSKATQSVCPAGADWANAVFLKHNQYSRKYDLLNTSLKRIVSHLGVYT